MLQWVWDKHLRFVFSDPMYSLFYLSMVHLQLKDTAERIKAVDAATALVEEMMKQGPSAAGALQSGGVSNHILFFDLARAYKYS